MIQERIYNYFERNSELKVLFIFDRMGVYEAELSETEWPGDYVYHIFDGKWFYLKVMLQRDWKDKRVVLLFPYELRPDTEEKRLNFPLLDVYSYNMEFKDQRYDEFIQQYGLPASLAPFVKNNFAELTSSRISTILSEFMDPAGFNIDVACRAFISSYLKEKKLLDWDAIIIRLIVLALDSEEKKAGDFYGKLLKNNDARKLLDEKLISIFGTSFNPNTEEKIRRVAEILKYNALTQSLSLSSQDNYGELKITNRRTLDKINSIYEKGMEDSQLATKFRQALGIMGENIKESELIRVYGADAPFFFITEEIAFPIISSILSSKLESSPKEAREQLRALSLRLGPDSYLMPVILYVEQLAGFFDEIKDIGSLRLDTANDYVSLYTEKFYKIDRFYRQIVDIYYNLPDLPEELQDGIIQTKRIIDQKYARLSNDLNNEWLDCILETDKYFKKTGILRQNEFYSTYQEPKKLVVIISDALRYEVAMELYDELAKMKHIAKISPMLSLLPSETKFCKPALFPHADLELMGDSLATDGKILSTARQRTDQLCRYNSDAVCVNFNDVSSQVNSHRELFKHALVYVMHDRIDNTGHNQNSKDISESCRKTVEELAKFINSLHMTLNCSNVIVTSDHGFLFNDIRFEEKDKISIKEDSFDSTSRYYLTHNADNVDELVKFEISEISDIRCSKKTYVATPKGTNRLAAPGGYKFTHGGASLQEMIVPVITSSLRREQSKKQVDVVLKSNNLNMVSSRVSFQLVQKEAVSMDVIPREVICRIYDGNRIVSDEVRVMLNSTDSENVSKRTFDVTLKLMESGAGSLLQLRVYDSDPQKQLNPLIKETVKNNTIIEQDF